MKKTRQWIFALLFPVLLLLPAAAFLTNRNDIFASQDTAAENVQGENAALPGLSDIPAYSGKPFADVNGDVPYFTELMTTAFDGYGPLDELGRATLAYACVGPETMPQQGRENISSVHPSGWNDAEYEFIDGKKLFNRCHLIGFQLTGQNANERNLITGTRYMNTEGMLPFENSVAAYVSTTGHHVMYRVTPIYEGDNLVASGVLMEAKSVEEPLVEYCAFCYNVQPGVVIDYATGESYEEGREENPEESREETQVENRQAEEVSPAEGAAVRALPAEDAEESGSAEENAQDYILNTNTKKFHYPSCQSVSDMKEKNKQEYHGTREEVLSMGYVPCGRCHP